MVSREHEVEPGILGEIDTLEKKRARIIRGILEGKPLYINADSIRQERLTEIMTDLVVNVDAVIEQKGGFLRLTDIELLMELGMDSEDSETPFYRASGAIKEVFDYKNRNEETLIKDMIRKYVAFRSSGFESHAQYLNAKVNGRKHGNRDKNSAV